MSEKEYETPLPRTIPVGGRTEVISAGGQILDESGRNYAAGEYEKRAEEIKQLEEKIADDSQRPLPRTIPVGGRTEVISAGGQILDESGRNYAAGEYEKRAEDQRRLEQLRGTTTGSRTTTGTSTGSRTTTGTSTGSRTTIRTLPSSSRTTTGSSLGSVNVSSTAIRDYASEVSGYLKQYGEQVNSLIDSSKSFVASMKAAAGLEGKNTYEGPWMPIYNEDGVKTGERRDVLKIHVYFKPTADITQCLAELDDLLSNMNSYQADYNTEAEKLQQACDACNESADKIDDLIRKLNEIFAKGNEEGAKVEGEIDPTPTPTPTPTEDPTYPPGPGGPGGGDPGGGQSPSSPSYTPPATKEEEDEKDDTEEMREVKQNQLVLNQLLQ